MMQRLIYSRKIVGHEERLGCDDFCLRIKERGWTAGNELMLFKIQCPEENGLSLKNLRWLDLEKKAAAPEGKGAPESTGRSEVAYRQPKGHEARVS